MRKVGEALELAIKKLAERRTSPLDFKRGWNDCWALVYLFEDYLREGEGKLSPLSITFSSFTSFLRDMRAKGFPTIPELMLHANYHLTKDPGNKEGDILLSRPYCLSVFSSGYWYSPQERSTKIIKSRTVPEHMMKFRIGEYK